MKYFLGNCFMWPTFGKSKFLWAIFESLMIAFEQDAMDLSLEHTKEQYTWIWWLNVKYLQVRAVFYVDNFWKIKISLGDVRILNDSRWAGRYGSFVGTYQRTAYLNLVAECEVFAWAVMYVDNIRKIKISLGNFRMRHDSPWAGGYGSFVGTYSVSYTHLTLPTIYSV